MEAQLAEARAQFESRPDDPDVIIWLGRRTAYLGRYREAINIFSRGIEKHPGEARFYRHRGHRYITLRCFDLAIADLEKAAKIIKGTADEIEPDGVPNARNTPTSTLQSNIWYHLGLAHYLKGDFKKALRSYRECLKVSKNPDMLVATAHWLYMTLRRSGRQREARGVLAAITEGMDIIENRDYHKLLLMYKGKFTAESLLEEMMRGEGSLSSASIGYGVGNWYLYNGEREKAVRVFRKIVESNQWASFGYIAAEVELKR
jgi:tetratricopeptide (TPR) repeat protein